MAKRITTIPATISRVTAAPVGSREKRKVAGYARVSTDMDAQQTSYEAQLDYYENYIKGHDDWEFAGMYSDEGISATSTAHRSGFNQMVEDALGGAIDLIITKSVSRFARNTVDSLSTIRKLKEHGTECYFEKENIWTFDSKGELLITIMSSLAQEESRSISENTTWGKRKSFADGKVSVAYGQFLGYDKGPDGGMVINEEQAETVRKIYSLFLSGLSFTAIKRTLEGEGIKAPGGGDTWHTVTIKSILSNEKYRGDALLQKKYTADFLTKKQVKNNGEIPQYYVEGDHPAIIPPRRFELVQAELQKRKRKKKYSGVSIFSSKIICGECGGYFGSKVWHSTDKYKKVVWRCNRKYGKGKKCSTPHLSEDEIKALFLKALNRLLADKDEIITNMEMLKESVSDTEGLADEMERVSAEMEVVMQQTENLIAENARTAQDQTEYARKYDALVSRYDEKKMRLAELQERKADAEATGEVLDNFIRTLRGIGDMVTEFDGSLWASLVESVTVYSKEEVTFLFKGGTEIEISKERERERQ